MVVDGRGRAGLDSASRAAAWAAVSGAAGLVAGALLLLYYVTAQPWRSSPNSSGWFGIANDYLVVVQFGALLPVVRRLGRLMAGDARARVWTRLGLAAAATIVGLQVLLIADLLPFPILTPLVSVCTILTILWVGGISGAGRRTGVLPDRLTGFGRLLGLGLGVALVSLVVGALVTVVADVAPAWVIGGLPGYAVWLLLPVWTLVLVPSIGRAGPAAGAAAS